MIVITRKTDEQIRIGDDVTVMIVGIRGKKVRLGIEAPKEVLVDREEVSVRRKDEGEQQCP